MKKILKILSAVILVWGILVAVEGFRLIGSTDPGKHPLITTESIQIADETTDYGSLGFSQAYYLSAGDLFVCGEFKVLGIPISKWEAE